MPYLVLEPTHNKQDFADAKVSRSTLKFIVSFSISYSVFLVLPI